MQERGYEDFALQYDRHAADHPYNARLERPAVLRACGSVAGRRVLDAGCAGGPLTGELLSRGASVTALDISPTLVDLTRARHPAATARVHDLREPLDFLADGAVDVVVCSLTMHYLSEWTPTLREFRRVLAPGGRVVLSTHHPIVDFENSPSGNYFATEVIEDVWESDDAPPLTVRFFRRPLGAVVADAEAAGLTVVGLDEPRPAEADRDAFADKFDKLRSRPPFLVLRLTARDEEDGR